MSKKAAVALAPILFYVGLVMLGFASFTASDLVFSDNNPLDDNTVATLQNSFISSISEYDVTNETSYEERFLYPKPTEDLKITIGLLIVRFDDLGNAIDGRNLSDIQTGGVVNRSYFVTINGNSSAVDPLNHDECLVESQEGVNTSYYCIFSFNVGNKSAGLNSPFDEVVVSSSSTNHRRTMNVVAVLPRAIPTSLETTQEIYSFYFNTSKTLWSLFLDVATSVWLVVRILFILSMIGLLLFILFIVFRWLTQ